MIQITNFQFLQYNINYNINQNIITGIYSVNEASTKKFLLYVSGINKANNIFYRSKKVFDNEEYFKERIFLDCYYQPFNTLLGSNISKMLLDNYNIVLNEDLFNKLVKDLQIRSEGKLQTLYHFSKEGIALINNALALSVFKYPILYKPFEEINNKYKLDYLKEKAKNKSALIGVSDLKKYEGFFDELILFGFTQVHILKSNETLLYLDNVLSQELTIEEAKLEKSLIHKCIKKESLIVRNDLAIDQIKSLHNMGVKIKEISIYDIGEYIC